MIYIIDGYTENGFNILEKIIFNDFHFYHNGEIRCFKIDKVVENFISSDKLVKILDNKLKKIYVINPFEQELFIRENAKMQNERLKILNEIFEKSKTKDVFVYQHFDSFVISFLEKQLKNVKFIRYATNPFETTANTEDVMDFLDYLINFDDKRIQTIFEKTSRRECEIFFYKNKKAWENNEFV